MISQPLFYPDDRPVPGRLATAVLTLMPLTPQHVHLDYAALMNDKEMLRQWSGSAWPEDDFTVSDNLKDQAYDCHASRLMPFN